jgi:hypothetical protein
MKIKYLTLAVFAAILSVSSPANAGGVLPPPVVTETIARGMVELGLISFSDAARLLRLSQTGTIQMGTISPRLERAFSEFARMRAESDPLTKLKARNWELYEEALSSRILRPGDGALDASPSMQVPMAGDDLIVPSSFHMTDTSAAFGDTDIAVAAAGDGKALRRAGEKKSPKNVDGGATVPVPSTISGNDDAFATFNVLNGKLEIGSIAKSKYFSVKGGEANLYKWGTVGALAAYCDNSKCKAEFLKKAIELDELLKTLNKSDLPN